MIHAIDNTHTASKIGLTNYAYKLNGRSLTIHMNMLGYYERSAGETLSSENSLRYEVIDYCRKSIGRKLEEYLELSFDFNLILNVAIDILRNNRDYKDNIIQLLTNN